MIPGEERRLAALVLIVVGIVYLPMWDAGWVWDDHQWADVAVDLRGAAFGNGTSLWRPLPGLGVALPQLFVPAPWPHHLLSLGLHLAAVAAVAVIARASGARPGVAWGAAACFGLHPGATEAVVWMSAMTERMPASLTLVGWAAMALGRPILAGCLFALTPFCKEAWLLLPLSIGLWGYSTRSPVAVPLLLSGAGSFAYLALRPLMDVLSMADTVAFEPFGPLGAATARGFQLLLVPATADVAFPYTPAQALGVAASLAVVVAAGISRGRPALGAFLFALPVLAPNALAAAATGIVADRYYYLPLGGVAVAGALVAERIAARASPSPAGRLVVLVPLFLGALTFARTLDWRDDATLFASSLARDPENPYAAFRLAYDLHTRRGRCAEAVPLYRQGLRADDRAVSGLQACLTELGQLDQIVALAPLAQTAAARKNLIRTYLSLGRLEEAVGAGEEAVAQYPDDAAAWALLGAALGRSGRLGEAEAAFVRALALDPKNVDATRGLAAARSAGG